MSQLPKEIEQFIKDEAEKAWDEDTITRRPNPPCNPHAFVYGFKAGATFMHTHLSESHEKEIAELKSEDLEQWAKNTAEKWADKFPYDEFQDVVYNLISGMLWVEVASLIEQHQQEIEGLKGAIGGLKAALLDMVYWDEEKDDEWGDQGNRASVALANYENSKKQTQNQQ